MWLGWARQCDLLDEDDNDNDNDNNDDGDDGNVATAYQRTWRAY
jgi:hypothetical protein